MKKLTSLFLALILFILLLVPQGAAFAETVSPAKLFTYSGNGNFERGIAVMTNGDVYVITNEGKIRGFHADGTENGFVADLPSNYCGNLCATSNGMLLAHTYQGVVCVYKPASSASYKKVYTGGGCQFLAVDKNNNIYCLRGETNSSGKKVAVILRTTAKSIAALENEAMIDWNKKYTPNYTAPSSDGNAYPRAVAVDGAGNAYIADQGSSNGYDASVSGVYKYNMSTGKVTAMQFVDSSGVVKLTWIYSISADEFGNVAVLSRNSNIIALFRPGSVRADSLISVQGWVEDLASDANGDLYYLSNGNINVGNAVFKCALNNKAATGLTLTAAQKTVIVSSSFTLGATVAPANATNRQVVYSTSNSKVATVTQAGVVKGVSAGKATITVKTVQGGIAKTCTVTVKKAANPLAVKAKTVTLKYSALKKRNQTVSRTKVLAVSKAKGKLTYVKKSGNKRITINKSTGKVTVKKGLKKGTYSIKVAVTAAGNATYSAKTKAVTFKIKVK